MYTSTQHIPPWAKELQSLETLCVQLLILRSLRSC
jgi:hypothetical protein